METLKTILVIEDEAELAEQLKEYLEMKGYKVLLSKTATDAITKCLNQAFDCILTDINLEKGTGDTVILNIKHTPRNPNYATPILVLSSAINVNLMNKVKDLIDWAFVKPYSVPAVIDKMQEVMKKPAKIHRSNS